MKVYGRTGAWRLAAVLLAFGLVAAVAPGASALVVHGRHGHFFGVTLHRGINPASVPGSVAAQTGATAGNPHGRSGALAYSGGPVVHSSAPYLVYWAPAGEKIDASWEALIQRYFSDVAADSDKSSNVYGVLRQYYDGTGFADYQQTFDPTTQVIVDTDPYPPRDASDCGQSSFATCLSDNQVQAELGSLLAANPTLPTDGSSTTELPSAAPIYFVVLPTDVDVCFSDSEDLGECASNNFCSYHSSFQSGGDNVLYATIPLLPLGSGQNPKSCQDDGYSTLQEPNASPADVALKYISHEDSEAITDPLGTAWWNARTGNEVGDNCDDVQTNRNSFGSPLGGSASAGTLYNQVINGDDYYLQGEWSNGDAACEMQPVPETISAQFTAPSSTPEANTSLSFDPSGSSSTSPYSSVTWSWGDGTSTTTTGNEAPAATSHTYTTGGTYTVTLTLVDAHGNVSSVPHQVTVYPLPSVASAPTSGNPNQTLSFAASASDPNDASPSFTYSWDFGDGSAVVAGATATHAYANPGVYTVTLTATDITTGLTGTATQQVTVGPIAAFRVSAANPLQGTSVAFSPTGSNPAPGSTLSYAWDFGDGTTSTDPAPTHEYKTTGPQPVTLTVTNDQGQTATVSRTVTVAPDLPVPAFSATPASGPMGQQFSFDAGGTTDPAGAYPLAYSWNFGDGSKAVETSTATHTYPHPGTYTVTLTATNTFDQTAQTSQTVTVTAVPPTASLTITPSAASVGQGVAFDASRSSDNDGGASLSYQWQFGDGASTGPSPSATATHTYAGPGTYTVTVIVQDSYGASTSTSGTVTVTAPPAPAATPSPASPPNPAISVATAQPVAGRLVGFSGTGSSDSGGQITSYQWTFGDGGSASGPAPSHTYARAGTYSVRLTVTNNFGQRSTAVRTVTVLPAERITGVRVSPTRSGATIFVSVNSAGTLTAPRHVFRLRRAGTVRFAITLTPAQLRTVRGGHQVKVRVPLRFAPARGPVTTTAAVVVFRAA